MMLFWEFGHISGQILMPIYLMTYKELLSLYYHGKFLGRKKIGVLFPDTSIVKAFHLAITILHFCYQLNIYIPLPLQIHIFKPILTNVIVFGRRLWEVISALYKRDPRNLSWPFQHVRTQTEDCSGARKQALSRR